MKKLISLLLALCLVLGLAACTPSSSAEDTKPADTKNEDTKPADTKDTEPTEPVNPYAGTEIEVWGIPVNQYSDISTVDAKSFWDLVVVAMWEWCEANDVTLKFGGDYNQNAYMAAINGGQTPDLIFYYSSFPAVANIGLTKPLTAEGAAAIGAVAGDGYVTALNYKGASHGVLLPVNGNVACWYNATIFEQYGLKTPKELWNEGNWNWETMTQCLKDVTKDLDGDGTNDTYGINLQHLRQLTVVTEEGTDGKLTSLAGTDKFRAFADIIYNGVTEGWIQTGTDTIYNIEGARSVFHIGDCELYNLNHVYWELENGDFLEVVPVPKYEESEAQLNNRLSYCLYNATSNDNQAATEAMLVYVQECALKFMADISMGSVECEYEGLRGTTDLSKLFLEKHAERLEEDKAKLELPHYDSDHVAKLYQYLVIETPSTIPRGYSGVGDPTFPYAQSKFGFMLTEPAATSVAKVIELLQKDIDTYNSTYVF